MAAALITALPTSATPRDQVPLRVSSCHGLPENLIPHLSPTQVTLRRFLQLCPVRDPNGSLALFVLIFRLDWADDAGLFDQGSPWYSAPTPDPQLLDPHFHSIGGLSEGFPTNVPGETKIVFSDWYAGFPHRIRIRVFNDAAFGTHDAPTLAWDERFHSFIEEPFPPATRRKR